MDRPTTDTAPAAEPPIRRRRAAARMAAVAIAAVSLIPIESGIRMLQISVPERCFEYCDPAGGGRLLIGLGIVGLALAAAVWRMYLVALGLGLCLSVLSVAVLGLVLIPDGLFGGGHSFDPTDRTRMLAVGGAFVVAMVFLAIALRERIAEAWAAGPSSRNAR